MNPTADQEHRPAADEIRPLVRRHRGPSAVWILPLLAALIAGWLVYKSYSEAGTMIEVVFDSADGLEENKTQVIYRGLPSGTVRSLRLNEDLQSVTARIEIAAYADTLLHQQTQFWLVKPQISLAGVRGLETLVSGHYIGVHPGAGPEARRFTALKEPPPAVHDEAGLYITLFADSVAAVHRGSPVYYRDITVGEVLDYRLTPNSDQIQIDLFIHAQYQHLVRKHSRFWNASSLEIKGRLPEIDIRVGSLATIIAGGVHFYTPPPLDNPAAEDGDQFQLFADYEAAEDGVPVVLRFPGTSPVSIGTQVYSRGVLVGRVSNLELSDDLKELRAELLIDPRARPLLREGSRFWMAQERLADSDLSLQGFLRGSYIELAPGAGGEQFSFRALEEAPARPPVYEGLAIELFSDQLGAIGRGSPVLYRQLPIGEVIGYELTETGDQVLIHAQVREKYRNLISPRSRFWNSSGIRFSANLSEGISLETGTVQTLLSGGISLLNPPGQPGTATPDGTRFKLYADRESASDQGRLLAPTQRRLEVLLEAPERGAITVGAPVLYRGMPVGEVSHYRLSPSGDSVQIQLAIDAPHQALVTTSSRFWVASGVRAQATLRDGVKIEAGSLPQLFNSGIAFSTEPGGERITPDTRFQLYDSEQASREQATVIQIHFAAGPELTAGAPIRYRGQQVGRIDQVRLAGEAGDRLAQASLFREGAFLAREGSQFWISEARIRLTGIDNAANLIYGNPVEVLPGQGAPTHHFIALRSAPPYQPQAGLTLELHAQRLGAIDIGSPVLYREVPVGEITGYELNLKGDGVRIYAHIDARHATLVRRSSRFYNHSGVRARAGLFSGIDLNLDSLETLIGGGVAFTTDDLSAPSVKERAVFRLYTRTAEDKPNTAREGEQP